MFASRFKPSGWFQPTFSTAASTLNRKSSAAQNLAADADEEGTAAIEEGPLMPDLRRLELRSESPPSCPQPSTPQDTPVDYTFSSKMPTTSPIDIATPTRNASSSPASQAQNNSKFLELDSRTSAMMSAGYDSSVGGGRQDSFSGAKPISMNNPNRNNEGRTRRESFAGSLVGGMSWGGVSVGSWIRDDIMMTGTSPFPMQSPSYHSASYMPKLEANFMRDFACCGINLPTLHDLLQHYEEMHATQPPPSLRNTASVQRGRDNTTPNTSKIDMAGQTVTSGQMPTVQQQQNHPARPSGLQIPPNAPPVGGISLLRQQPLSQPATPIQKNIQTIPDDSMDGVEDMEMDDAIGSMNQAPDTPIQQTQHSAQVGQQSLFGQPPRPQLNMNANGMQYSGLRTSQPATPASSGYGFQHNPTVSSVNTPTLSTQPMQQTPFSTQTSIPSTPGEMDDDYTSFPMNLNTSTMANQQYPFGFGGNDMGLDLCIDEPARRLYQPNGGGQQSQKAMAQQFAQFGLGQGQMANSSDFMQAYQQQQQQMMTMNGMTPQQAALAVMLAEEHKPFKCPVIGCEKAYKNQNGLKYHKAHGHQTQQLHENGDGTFSIVNPETSIPYQGEAGMAKEKPYRCDICGKRYKNLNGLKYHKQHSPPCNPELKLTSHMVAAGLGGLNGLNINVAGLPGIEEGM